jgi:hypothetical protein
MLNPAAVAGSGSGSASPPLLLPATTTSQGGSAASHAQGGALAGSSRPDSPPRSPGGSDSKGSTSPRTSVQLRAGFRPLVVDTGLAAASGDRPRGSAIVQAVVPGRLAAAAAGTSLAALRPAADAGAGMCAAHCLAIAPH